MLEENKQFTIKMIENKMLFSWNEISSISKDDYKYALGRIAFHCAKQEPVGILLDKLKFQPNVSFDKDWYNKQVLPCYHKAKIQFLGHITGKVKRYKHLPISEEFNFEHIEFESLIVALNWEGYRG